MISHIKSRLFTGGTCTLGGINEIVRLLGDWLHLHYCRQIPLVTAVWQVIPPWWSLSDLMLLGKYFAMSRFCFLPTTMQIRWTTMQNRSRSAWYVNDFFLKYWIILWWNILHMIGWKKLYGIASTPCLWLGCINRGRSTWHNNTCSFEELPTRRWNIPRLMPIFYIILATQYP